MIEDEITGESFSRTHHRVVISDSYRVEYQRAKAAGQLSPSCKPDEPSGLRILPVTR